MKHFYFLFFIFSVFIINSCQYALFNSSKKLNIVVSSSSILVMNKTAPLRYGERFCIGNNCDKDTSPLNGMYLLATEYIDTLYCYERIWNLKNGFKEGKQLTLTGCLGLNANITKYYKLRRKLRKGEIFTNATLKNSFVVLIEEYFKKGLRSGKYIVFDKYGKVLYTTKFKKGTGYEKSFYPHGKLKYEGHLKNGKKVGVWKYYDEKSQLISQKTYK